VRFCRAACDAHHSQWVGATDSLARDAAAARPIWTSSNRLHWSTTQRCSSCVRRARRPQTGQQVNPRPPQLYALLSVGSFTQSGGVTECGIYPRPRTVCSGATQRAAACGGKPCGGEGSPRAAAARCREGDHVAGAGRQHRAGCRGAGLCTFT
jgi:hypothetical protein